MAFIPPGYGLVAKTEMLGTGGTAVRAFFDPRTRRLIISITYTEPEGQERVTFMGPVEMRHLQPLLQTLRDVMDMPQPGFIEDNSA